MTELQEYQFCTPGKEAALRLERLRPFVRHAGDGVRNRWHFGERKIFDWLWVFIGSGEGIFKVGAEEFKVSANDFIWIAPDTLHEMRGTSDKMRCLFAHVDLIFDPVKSPWGVRVPAGVRDLEPWRERLPALTGCPEIDSLSGRLKLKNPARVLRLFAELCAARKTRPEMFLRLSGLALEILDEILSSEKARENPLELKIAEAEAQIRASLNRNIDIRALAKKAGLSASYFRRLFRETRGAGPAAFHRSLRIQEACKLMLDEGMNVSETACELGFSNIHNFSRAFKELSGQSPKEYRGKMSLK